MSNSIDERQERQASTSLCHRLYNNRYYFLQFKYRDFLKVYSKTTTMLNTCQYENAWNVRIYMS